MIEIAKAQPKTVSDKDMLELLEQIRDEIRSLHEDMERWLG